MTGLAPPLPPNRTGGFPASGSPVSGVSVRLTIGTGAMFQTKQPLRRKPAVLVVGPLCSSRVSMRSVHTECSTHHQRSRMSAACGGEVTPATAAARLVSSFVIDFTPPLPCVPSLHGHYPVPRYYGRSDSRRAALRALGP